jgi:hypothetical protein
MYWYNPTTRTSERVEAPSTDFTGQSAGMIEEILPTGEIVRRMVAEAEQALRIASTFLP